MNDFVEIASIMGGSLAAVFGLVKYMVGKMESQQKTLLEFLQTKNGHMERIADKFNTTANGFGSIVATTMNKLTEQNKDLTNSINNLAKKNHGK